MTADGGAALARWDDGELLAADAPSAAVALLGAHLVREWPSGESVVARIVETEAYRQDDPASHSSRGATRANASMFAAPGTAYVYRSYGVHWCLNVAVEPEGRGAAVLLRAATVVEGVEVVRALRPARRDHQLLRGPGNLTAGLDVDGGRHDGLLLTAAGSPIRLVAGAAVERSMVRCGPRTGVRLAADVLWRFHLDVPEVSTYRRHRRAEIPREES